MVHGMKSLDTMISIIFILEGIFLPLKKPCLYVIGLQVHDEFCSLQSYTLHKGFSGSKQESYMCDQLERLEGVVVAFLANCLS